MLAAEEVPVSYAYSPPAEPIALFYEVVTFKGPDGTTDVGDEACDDGAVDNDGRYGGCNPDCTAGPVCGDGSVDPGETCDPPGSAAGGNGNACRADCTVCGDDIVNSHS